MERGPGPRVVVLGVEKGAGMSRADRYRQFAAECLRVAQQSSSADDKAMLLEMAKTWRQLTDRASKAGKDPGE